MADKNILVAEDDSNFRRVLKQLLESEGYRVIFAEDGREALDLFRSQQPDLVILDVMMPKMDGMEVCRRIREESSVPVLFLTARGETDDLLEGLSAGGDSYITKFASSAEIIARIRAALRRADIGPHSAQEEEHVSIRELEIDRRRREVFIDGELIDLTRTEFDLLWLLASNKGIVVSKEEIMEALWGPDSGKDWRLIAQHTSSLRKKIEGDSPRARFIETITGVGYKLL